MKVYQHQECDLEEEFDVYDLKLEDKTAITLIQRNERGRWGRSRMQKKINA